MLFDAIYPSIFFQRLKQFTNQLNFLQSSKKIIFWMSFFTLLLQDNLKTFVRNSTEKVTQDLDWFIFGLRMTG